MSNIIYKIIQVLVLLLMVGFVSACDEVYESEFLHTEETAGGNPIIDANCSLTLNNTQVYTNTTNADGLVSFCYNSSDFNSISSMSCTKPSTYSARITNASCQGFVYLGNVQSFTFRLTNTLGESLEAQDCYTRVFYDDVDHPYLVEDLKTNLLYDNQTFIDGNGNYIRTAGVPLTSSRGIYAITWPIREYDENGYRLYRPYQDYVVSADCNGKVINCSFSVDNYEPVHMAEDTQWYMDNMQVITFGVAVALIGWFFIIPTIKKGGFWSGGND